MRYTDVAIVGGGLAGSTTAAMLRVNVQVDRLPDVNDAAGSPLCQIGIRLSPPLPSLQLR